MSLTHRKFFKSWNFRTFNKNNKQPLKDDVIQINLYSSDFYLEFKPTLRLPFVSTILI
jgi:hypothetical protein